MKKYEKIWNFFFKTTSEQLNHFWIFSVAFPSSMLLRSRDCCMRGSNSFTFGHSSRPWHPSSTVPHPHIHFEKLAAIPGAWLSVCTPMIYLRRPGKSTRNSWVVAPNHEARILWYSAHDMTEDSCVHDGFQRWKRTRLVQLNDVSHSVHFFIRFQGHSFKSREENEKKLHCIISIFAMVSAWFWTSTQVFQT